MGKTFKIDNIEYEMIFNLSGNKPMVSRSDGFPVDNRKEICRRFLRAQGWTNEMIGDKNTNTLEKKVYDILNGNDSTKEIKVRTPKQQKVNKSNIPNPSVKEVEYWLKEWDKLEDYTAQEDAIDKLFFGEFKTNDNLQNILIKCSVLNDFYSTNIFKIYPVAKHILSLKIDKRLKKGDPTLVNDIARVKISNSDKNFYSFASKYCSHHNPLEFPIYDSYVHKVLVYFRKLDGFTHFNDCDLKDYLKFKNVLIEFRKFYKLEKYNLKELDKYLWQFGKKYFPKSY